MRLKHHKQECQWSYILHVCLLLLYFLLFVLPVVTSFCGNMILKIAPLANGPLLSQVVQAAAHSWCMTHSLLIIIPLPFHPTQAPPALISDGGGVWGRGSGYYKAGVSVLWLAGGIHLICCDYYGVCSHTPPPRSACPDSIRTQQCAVCVPGRISALRKEERISVTTQLICIHVPREPHEHPGLQLSYKIWLSYLRDSSSSVIAGTGLHRDYRAFWLF